jgi:hypothetical protein
MPFRPPAPCARSVDSRPRTCSISLTTTCGRPSSGSPRIPRGCRSDRAGGAGDLAHAHRCVAGAELGAQAPPHRGGARRDAAAAAAGTQPPRAAVARSWCRPDAAGAPPVTDPVVTIGRLRRVAELGPAAPSDDLIWLAGRFAEYLRTDGADLEALLGLRCGQGGDHWRTQIRRSERDRLLCELAQHYPDIAALAVEIRRYETCIWPRERHHRDLPPSTDERRRLLWQIFACGLRVPTSIKWLREILEGSEPGFSLLRKPGSGAVAKVKGCSRC